MCCMNCTSAGEFGGSLALVEEGKVFVGFPGAPGWTTTGDCCAKTDSANKQGRAMAAMSPPRRSKTLITARI
jgi:hypothetical protein